MRYQIVYAKTTPLAAWRGNAEDAVAFAKLMKGVGYDVSVWEHSDEGVREVNVHDLREERK